MSISEAASGLVNLILIANFFLIVEIFRIVLTINFIYYLGIDETQISSYSEELELFVIETERGRKNRGTVTVCFQEYRNDFVGKDNQLHCLQTHTE